MCGEGLGHMEMLPQLGRVGVLAIDIHWVFITVWCPWHGFGAHFSRKPFSPPRFSGSQELGLQGRARASAIHSFLHRVPGPVLGRNEAHSVYFLTRSLEVGTEGLSSAGQTLYS